MATSSAAAALNPEAPIFVPSAYRSVEDFSDQWWSLVQSSPSFRDYWLRECFSDPQIIDHHLQFPDNISLSAFILSDEKHKSVVAKEKDGGLDLMALGWLKWRKPRGGEMMPRYCEKAPPKKIVNVKVSPRPIQQPR